MYVMLCFSCYVLFDVYVFICYVLLDTLTAYSGHVGRRLGRVARRFGFADNTFAIPVFGRRRLRRDEEGEGKQLYVYMYICMYIYIYIIHMLYTTYHTLYLDRSTIRDGRRSLAPPLFQN